MPPVTSKAPRASKFASRPARTRSRLSRAKAPSSASTLKGTLMNSTQRQPGPSVSRPPKRTPAAPPIPETAAQTPSAVLRSRVLRKVLVSVERAAGDIIAAPTPWAKRAPTSSELVWARPPSSDEPAKTIRPLTSTLRRPSRSAMRPPRSKKPP